MAAASAQEHQDRGRRRCAATSSATAAATTAVAHLAATATKSEERRKSTAVDGEGVFLFLRLWRTPALRASLLRLVRVSLNDTVFFVSGEVAKAEEEKQDKIAN